MDYIEIRLASDDEGALRQFANNLRKSIPAIRFGHIQIGRTGDWACRGDYDEARIQIGLRHKQISREDILAWLYSYRAVRSALRQKIGRNNLALQALEVAIRDVERQINQLPTS